MAGCRDAWMGSAQGLAVTADFALFVKQCLVLWQLAVFYELYIIAVRIWPRPGVKVFLHEVKTNRMHTYIRHQAISPRQYG